MNLKSQIHRISCFPYRHFERSRKIFLALCSFLLLSQKASYFPLSHIRHYPLLQERSLDFARDDDTGIALSKHIRCTLREINPFSPTVISSAARNLPCTLPFLAPFAEGFPFPAVSHTALYWCAKKIPRLRSGWRYRNSAFQTYPLYAAWNKPIPLIPSFRAQREIFLALRAFLLPSQKFSPFPLSHIRRYTGVPERSLDSARDDVARNSAFQTYSLYATWNKPIPPYRHFERSEKSSLHSALSCSFRKRFPLFHYHTYDIIPSCKKDPSASLGMTIQE